MNPRHHLSALTLLYLLSPISSLSLFLDDHIPPTTIPLVTQSASVMGYRRGVTPALVSATISVSSQIFINGSLLTVLELDAWIFAISHSYLRLWRSWREGTTSRRVKNAWKGRGEKDREIIGFSLHSRATRRLYFAGLIGWLFSSSFRPSVHSCEFFVCLYG